MSYLDDMIDSSDAFEFNLIRRDESGVCCIDLTSSDDISYRYDTNQILFIISSEGYDKHYFNYLRKYYRDIFIDKLFTCVIRDIDDNTATVRAEFKKLNMTPKIGFLTDKGSSDDATWSSFECNGFIGYSVMGVFNILVDEESVKKLISKAVTEWNDYYVDRVIVAYPIDDQEYV